MFLILSLLVSSPSIQDTIMPEEYLVCGPFLTGVRENTWRILPDDPNFTPKEGDSLFSVQTTGGWQKWEKVKVDSTGWLRTSYPNVGWDTLQDFYGISALYNSGYAYAEVNVPKRSRALALAMGCSFSINERSYMGDVYASGTLANPVILDKGRNRIWLYLGGAGDDRVSFTLVPVDDDVRIIERDATLPDLVYGADNGTLYGAIPVCNTGEEWLRNAKLVVGGKGFKERAFDLPPIAPMNFYKAPFDFKLLIPLLDSIPGDSLILPVSVIWDRDKVETTLKIRCRRPDQSRKETFVSEIDGSVQYFGLMPPGNYDPARKYPLILSLHGASVEALSQVDSYTQKDWAFVACPTNRRPYGFDWQDWGRLDALEVLGEVMRRYPIDERKVHLTGHSMGGHGTWHVGLTYPDLFASLSPEAGWTNHELYSAWTWQKSAIFAEPWQLEVRNQALRSDNQLARIENASNLPVFILQGGADDNVPAFQARLYASRLNQLGYDYRYVEVPDKPHWWGDSNGACVNWPDIMQFMQKSVRPEYPKRVFFGTANIAEASGAYWLRIHTISDPMKDATIKGWIDDYGYHVSTTNVGRFSIKTPENNHGYATIMVTVNDDTLTAELSQDSMVFEVGDGDWHVANSQDYPLPHSPIKSAYYQPFILVYGTKSDTATTSKLMRIAVSESQRWWIVANGCTYVVADTSVTSSMMERYNLILIGNSEQNKIVAAVEKDLPIKINRSRFVVNGEILPANARAALFIYPNPLNPAKKILVREGIEAEGLRLSGYFSTLYSGAGLPDYIIWSTDVWDKGWGGVVKAGFFNADWTP